MTEACIVGWAHSPFGKLEDPDVETLIGRVARAAALGACNAVLVKPNQAGTLTEAKAAWDAARGRGWGALVSARSGETERVVRRSLALLLLLQDAQTLRLLLLALLLLLDLLLQVTQIAQGHIRQIHLDSL